MPVLANHLLDLDNVVVTGVASVGGRGGWGGGLGAIASKPFGPVIPLQAKL